MARIFQNLISNAIKYRGECAPRIQIRSEYNEGRGNWHISVIDNGRGIAKSDATRVFEMLARCHESAAVSGNGIGLAVCKRIAEAHGGDLELSSYALGTKFCLTLPRENP